jgi:hypothetical protein
MRQDTLATLIIKPRGLARSARAASGSGGCDRLQVLSVRPRIRRSWRGWTDFTRFSCGIRREPPRLRDHGRLSFVRDLLRLRHAIWRSRRVKRELPGLSELPGLCKLPGLRDLPDAIVVIIIVIISPIGESRGRRHGRRRAARRTWWWWAVRRTRGGDRTWGCHSLIKHHALGRSDTALVQLNAVDARAKWALKPYAAGP